MWNLSKAAYALSFRDSHRHEQAEDDAPPVPLTCTLEVIGGREPDGYGAWTLCSDRISPGGVVFSFGIGGDVSFDNDLIERGLTVRRFLI